MTDCLMSKTILIISDVHDPEVDSVESILISEKANIFRFDTTRFARGEITITFKSDGTAILKDKNQAVALSDISSVWFTRPFAPQPPIEDPERHSFAKQEMINLMEHLYFLIPNAFWLNKPEVVFRVEKKLFQLLAAQKAGIAVPETCISNEPSEIRTFVSRFNDKVLYKTLQFAYFLISYDKKSKQETIDAIPASIIEPEHLTKINSIRYTGGIFQPYLDKEYELRVTVVNGQFFTAKIDSQNNTDTLGKVDFRRGEISKETLTPYELPESEKAKILKLMKDLDISYGAFDFVKEKSGKYIFLEVNTAGSFHWIEKITNQPISRAIAETLLNCS